MTPDDAVRIATQEALRPYVNLIEKLVGPFTEEVGEGLRMTAASWRLQRQLRFWQRAQEMISAAGIDPRPVQPKIVFSITQSASLEDDDELQDLWAALLAHAANSSRKVPPAFPEVLRQLSRTDALYLSNLRAVAQWDGQSCIVDVDTEHFFQKVHPDSACADYELSMDNLERLGLIATGRRYGFTVNGIASHQPLEITALGVQFLQACEPPESGVDSEI